MATTLCGIEKGKLKLIQKTLRQLGSKKGELSAKIKYFRENNFQPVV